MIDKTALDNAQAIVDDMRARLGNASFLYSENQFLIGTNEALGNLGHYLNRIARCAAGTDEPIQGTGDQCIYLFSDDSRCQNDTTTHSNYCADCEELLPDNPANLAGLSPEMVRAHNLDGRGSDREYDCGVSTGDLARDNKDPHDITS